MGEIKIKGKELALFKSALIGISAIDKSSCLGK